MATAIDIQRLGKQYRLRYANAGSIRDVVNRSWARLRNRTEPRAAAGNGKVVPRGREIEADGSFWAIRDISLRIQEGEVLGVIGSNGSGKSTLLKVLSHITSPTAGRVELYGRVGSLLEVGTGFHPELTGHENIFLNGAILGMTRAEIGRKFDEIVDFAEVSGFLDTPVKRYSSGMHVRLAFAVAAHLEPEIILIDEVLAVGDAAFQKKCLGQMRSVAHQGRSVVFVSHNMAAVAQLCTRVLWLDAGRQAGDGRPDKLIPQYLQSTSSQVPDRSWSYPGDAPGDDRVRLLRCRVVQEGETATVLDINLPARVELTFRILRPVRNLVAGIGFYDLFETCLFSHCDWRPNALASGVYQKSVHLPAQLLAEGRYNILVEMVFYDPDIKSIVEREAVQVETMDSDHPRAVRGLYKGAWPGQVRVSLDWDAAELLPQ